MSEIISMQKELCEKLWNECEEKLRRICRIKLSGYPDEVDDVISDTYLILCEAITQNRIPDNPKAWLYGTLNNRIKMKYTEINKKLKLVESLDDNSGKTALLKFEPNFSFEKVSDEIIDKIKDELFSELTSDEQLLYHYVYDKKMKMKDIAKLLQSNEFAIKQRHYRLCNKIRKKAKEKIENYT